MIFFIVRVGGLLMIKEYITHEIFGREKDVLNLSQTNTQQKHYSFNSYYRDIESSVFLCFWKIASHPAQILACTDSIKSVDHNFVTSHFTDKLTTSIHQHSHIELVYIVSGKLHQQIGKKIHCFQQGDLILVNENTPHREIVYPEDAIILFLNIQSSFFRMLFYNGTDHPISSFIKELLIDKNEPYSYLYFAPKSPGNLRTPHILLQIIKEIHEKEPGSTLILPGLIVRLLAYITQEYNISLKKEAKEQLKQLMFQDIEHFIRQNCRDITIEALQERYHYNPDYFNRFIKKCSGQTYQQLRQNIRLEHAWQLITQTDIKIEEISREVGYENIGFFYRIFEKKYGMTPGEVRKRNYKA